MAEQLLAPGQVLGFLDPLSRERRQYRVQRLLGRGAFTQAYLASGPQGFVVLKASVEGVDLTREGKVHRALSHPNLVRFRGSAFDANWRAVLAFDRLFPNPLLQYNRSVEVERLESHLGGRYHPLPLALALDLQMDLLSGLAHIHEAGFVHGDVKPTNFLLDLGRAEEPRVAPRAQLQDLRRGRAQGALIDLGSSWSHQEGEEAEALGPGPQLTPLYAPPEALLADASGKVLHPTMDTYAAGLLFFLTLTGHLPYPEVGPRPSDLLAAKRQERAGRLSPVDLARLEELRGFTLHGMRPRELKLRLRQLLLDWLDPDPTQRTTIAKARNQLETAFAFTPDAAGRLRQRTVEGHLVIPHEGAS